MIYSVKASMWTVWLNVSPKTKTMYEGSASNVILDGCPGS